MICNVFRPKRKINGRVHVGRLYRGRFKLDGEFKVTTLPLHTTDKQLASRASQPMTGHDLISFFATKTMGVSDASTGTSR